MPKRIDVGAEIIEFPDDMADSEIEAVLRKQFPTPKPPQSANANPNNVPYNPDATQGNMVARAFKAGAAALNPMPLAEAVMNPGQTLDAIRKQSERKDAAAQAAGKRGEYGRALLDSLESVPVIGGMIENAENRVRNLQIPELIGEAAAMKVAPRAAAEVPGMVKQAGPAITKARDYLAQRLMQSALKPGVADAKTMKDVRAITNTALEQKTPVSEGGLEKLQGLSADQLQRVQDIVDDYASRGYAISPQAAADRIRQIEPRFAAQVAPKSDIKDIGRVRDEFLNAHGGMALGFDEAQAIKQGTYQQIQGQYGKASDAAIEAQKTIARGLREEMERIAPELAGENAKLGAMVELEGALARAVRRGGNADFTDGSRGGLTMGAWRKTIGNPYVKSRLALALYEGAKASGKPISKPSATLKAGTVLSTIINQNQEGKQ